MATQQQLTSQKVGSAPGLLRLPRRNRKPVLVTAKALG